MGGTKKQLANNKKTNFVRPTMNNPLMGSSKENISTELANKVKAEIAEHCGKMFAGQVTKEQAKTDLTAQNPKFSELELKDKKAMVGEWITKMKRKEGLDLESRKFLRIGLKKVMKALREEDGVSAVIYDPETNIGAIKPIVDKGEFPMIGVPGLRDFVRRMMGFPATTLAFSSETLDESNLLNPLVKMLRATADFSAGKRPNSEKQEPEAKRKKVDFKSEVTKETPKGKFGDDYIKL